MSFGRIGAMMNSYAPIKDIPQITCSDDPSQQCQTRVHIIRSFFAMTFLCAAVSVKPNMGDAGERQWRHIFRQVKLAFWAAIVPELILLWALKQYVGARSLQQEFSRQRWTMAHGHFMQMGGFTLYGTDHKPIGVLSSVQFRKLLLSGQIHFPEITEDDIWDRSKNNTPIKLFSLCQMTWFMVQIFERGRRGLLMTPFDILGLSSVVASALLFRLWWDKPLNVRCSVPVHLLDENDSDHADYMPKLKKINTAALPFSKEKLIREFGTKLEPGCMRVPTYYFVNTADARGLDDIFPRVRLPLSCIATALLGIIYCSSVFFNILEFPTWIEDMLWKGCMMVVVTAICVLLVEMSGIYTYHNLRKSILARRFLKSYLVARSLMLVLAFLSLRSLPVRALTTVKWVSNIPHV
ncbi:hypothetical protein JR316_0010065 [Psilocybe cubensis]|uniref:Uncharacterized protein n=2 Tax=Psilocybe cubensis TaxID=181762 RepID=A0ACB8GQD6_PSICU|nr:hypothetical protein JR316_0010065 [Psilocybe cubensis]KAH9477833.1 hypothetical protein JR316_0010065 [Psilocybe cubensis]